MVCSHLNLKDSLLELGVLRVAIVTETFLPQINGIVRTIERLIRHLEDSGHEVLLIAMGGGATHYSQTTVLRVAGERFIMYPELYLALPENPILRQLISSAWTQIGASMMMSMWVTRNSVIDRALREFQPDIVHLVSPATLGAMAYDYVRSSKTACLATYHTDIAAYTAKYHVPFLKTVIDRITQLVYSRASRVLAPSLSSKLQLERDCGLSSVGIFSRGVDTELFRPREEMSQAERTALQSSLGLDPNCLTILYAGRLAGEKSLPVLCRDFKELSDAGHPVQLLLVGDGPMRASLEADLKRYPAVFAGFRQAKEYAQMFQIADIFAFPSRTETFGQVVQEAMASALPVIVFDAPGVRDLICHERTGLIAKTQSLYPDLLRLIRDEALRKSLAQAAYDDAKTKSWKQVLDGLLEEYKKTISES